MKQSVVATIISLQVGQPRTVGGRESSDPFDEVWTTGFFKLPVTDPVWLGTTNLNGDGQADLKNHGGPEKAVNVYPVEHYPYWQQVLGATEFPFGSFGENFTTDGLLETEVCLGDIFEVGSALVQVSQPRQPCWKLARRWRIKDLALRVQESWTNWMVFPSHQRGNGSGWVTTDTCGTSLPRMDGGLRKRRDASTDR